MKLLLPKRRLKPRTFRAAEGQTVFAGGVLRVDVLRCPGATLYLTVWASDDLACHFGKTEGADERCRLHTLSTGLISALDRGIHSWIWPPITGWHAGCHACVLLGA